MSDDKPDDIDTMRAKALRGVEQGREYLADHPDLLQLLNKTYANWLLQSSMVVTGCVGLAAMSHAEKDQVLAFMRLLQKRHEQGEQFKVFASNLPEC